MQEENAAAVINPYPAGKTTSSVFHLARFAAPSEAAEAAAGWGSAPCPGTSPAASPAARLKSSA